jgi:hypothetical protein
MKKLVAEWVKKAEGDAGTAKRPVFPDLKELSDDLEWLSEFAVEFRYPGEEAVEEDAKSALAIMDRALTFLRSKIQGHSPAKKSYS